MVLGSNRIHVRSCIHSIYDDLPVGSLFTGNVHPVGLIVAIIELVFIIYMLARKNPYVDEATGMAKKSIA